MMRKIVKRDGRKVRFEPQKIGAAIRAAFESVERPLEDLRLLTLVTKVVNIIDETFKDQTPVVEDIQDAIEKVLIFEDEAEVAKSFILYRARRTAAREADSSFMRLMSDISFKNASENDIKRENANIDGDTAMGTMLKYGSEAAKAFYASKVINPRFAEAHRNGDIHIHDMDFYTLTMTCCQIDLITLFANGFSTGHGFLREPTSIRSYASLACIAIQANQNDQHGGQSIPNFDYAMAIGVRKSYRRNFINEALKALKYFDVIIDKVSFNEMLERVEKQVKVNLSMDDLLVKHALVIELGKMQVGVDFSHLINKVSKFAYDITKDETYQAMEALLHNLNTMHSRAGAQVPFSSVNYGTDTTTEGRLVMECMLDSTLKGLGNGETPIFPIQVFKVKKGVSYLKEDPNYDLFRKALVVSGHRLFPNFSFLDAPYNKKYYKEGDYRTEVVYMGCRTRVIANVDKEKEIVTGRGNLSFTSINLPRIAIDAKGDLEVFYARLTEVLDLVKDQILERYEIQAKKKVYNFPFLMGQHIWLDSDKLDWNDEIRPVLKHGTLSIGFIGLAETLVALIGSHHGENEAAKKLGFEIVSFLRKKCDEYVAKYQLNFSLLATPAEGLSGRFVRLDRSKYGSLTGITDRDFYTNSFHVPVYYPISIAKKIEIEGPYCELTNAGHICYVEVDGDIAKNPDAFESIIKHMYEHNVGYGSVNHPIDRDPVCGFNGIIDNVCPKCGRSEGDIEFERIRRITGYLVGTLSRFNNGKRAEEKARVKHLTKADHHINDGKN